MTVDSGEEEADMKAWDNLNLPPDLIKALAQQRFTSPTLIQELTCHRQFLAAGIS